MVHVVFHHFEDNGLVEREAVQRPHRHVYYKHFKVDNISHVAAARDDKEKGDYERIGEETVKTIA